MKHLRIRTIALLCLLLYAWCLAGCRQSDSSSGQASSSIMPAPSASENASAADRLRLVAPLANSAADALAEAFAETAGDGYSLELVTGSNDNAAILQALAAGQVDVAVLPYSSALEDGAAGVLLPLNDIWETDEVSAQSGGASVASSNTSVGQGQDDEAFYIPCAQDRWVVWYSKSAFDAAAQPYPDVGWTWENFRSTALALAQSSGTSHGAVCPTSGQGNAWALPVYQMLGAHAFFDEKTGGTRFADSLFQQQLTLLYGMMYSDASLMPAEECRARELDDPAHALDALTEQLGAMVVAPASSITVLRQGIGGPAGDIGMAPLPRPAGAEQSTTITQDYVAVISAKTQHLQAAKKLLRLICLERPQLMAGALGMQPGIVPAAEDAGNAQSYLSFVFGANIPAVLDSAGVSAAMQSSVASVTPHLPDYKLSAQLDALCEGELQLLFSGQQSIAACLANLQAAGDALLLQ